MIRDPVICRQITVLLEGQRSFNEGPVLTALQYSFIFCCSEVSSISTICLFEESWNICCRMMTLGFLFFIYTQYLTNKQKQIWNCSLAIVLCVKFQITERIIWHIKADLASRLTQNPSVPTCYREYPVPYPEVSCPQSQIDFSQRLFLI